MDQTYEEYESIDLKDLWARVARGVFQILGLAALGLVIALAVYFVASPFQDVSTSTRVSFAFDGFAKGEYPDASKFSPEDLRAPDVITDAVTRRGLTVSEADQARVRAAFSVEPIIPSDVTKQRDKIRAAGGTPPVYIPDEYAVILTLPRKFPLTLQQREELVNEVINVYREKFQRTYEHLPVDFGNARETLNGADYSDYELVLSAEMRNIVNYLRDQNDKARSFRSSTTNLTFSDLLKKTELFDQVQLSEVLGLIRMNSLTRDRAIALLKMDYKLQTLHEQERLAAETETVAQNYLSKAQERAQGYVMGIKSQANQPRSNEAPIVDQGLVDSLLANDAYNFTLRKAMDASLQLKTIQSEIRKLELRREQLAAVAEGREKENLAVRKQVEAALKTAMSGYDQLIMSIRKTHADWARQQFADAIRITDGVRTQKMLRQLVMPSVVGLFVGFAAGIGLSLLGVYIGARQKG